MSNVIPMPGRGIGGTSAANTRAVYTVAEVAVLLSLSLSGTYAMVRLGQIPAKRMGGRWVIPKRRFHAWLDDLPEATDDEIAREIAKVGGGDL